MFYVKNIAINIFMLMSMPLHALTDIFNGTIIMNQNNGTFFTHDIANNPIALQWEAIEGHTIYLAQKIKAVANILIPSYAKTEVNFAQRRPDLVASDFMLKSLASLMTSDMNNSDWSLFEEKVTEMLTQFFAHTDWTAHSKSCDTNIFVTAIDHKTNEQLGIIQFLISPDFGQNTVKAALFGVISSAQSKNIEQILMSSIFKILPDTERIFLHTRSTNVELIANYKDWGFTEFPGKLSNWTDLEYVAKHSNTLQKYLNL